MFYKNELERIRKELNEIKNDLRSELRYLPEGELLLTDQNGYRRYMQRLAAKGNRKKEHRYGIKKNPRVLNGLVRKEYVTDALKVIDQDIRALDLVIKRYRPIDENTIMKDFVTRFPELKGGIYHEMVDTDEWIHSFSRIENYHPENLKHYAADGTQMRSKNELYIASRLDHYGIEYRTDCPTGIPGVMGIPDFTIRRRRDLRILYWEHLGMMDIPQYREDNKEKIKEYEEAGIVPWDNLIITYDTVNGGLRADIIEAMIKCWLL